MTESNPKTTTLRLGFLNFLLRHIATHQRRYSDPVAAARRSILVSPANAGSLGDRAMMETLAQELRDRGVSELQVACFLRKDRWELCLPVDHFRMPGGTRSWMEYASRLSKVGSLFVIGADVLDGYYSVERSVAMLRMAWLAGSARVPTTILGCSWSSEAKPLTSQWLSQMPANVRILARDAHSQQRMSAIVGREIPLVADMAFLLRPATPDTSARLRNLHAWIRQISSAGKPLILGCNINPLPVDKARQDPKRLAQSYASMFARLASEGANPAIVLLPHDFRHDYSDRDALKDLVALLPDGVPVFDEFMDEGISAAEAKGAAGLCHAVVTGRMHLAIAALGSGVPAACIAYQGKVEALFSHFSLPNFSRSWEDAMKEEVMYSLGRQLIDHLPAATEAVAKALPAVRALSAKNLS